MEVVNIAGNELANALVEDYLHDHPEVIYEKKPTPNNKYFSCEFVCLDKGGAMAEWLQRMETMYRFPAFFHDIVDMTEDDCQGYEEEFDSINEKHFKKYGIYPE